VLNHTVTCSIAQYSDQLAAYFAVLAKSYMNTDVYKAMLSQLECEMPI